MSNMTVSRELTQKVRDEMSAIGAIVQPGRRTIAARWNGDESAWVLNATATKAADDIFHHAFHEARRVRASHVMSRDEASRDGHKAIARYASTMPGSIIVVDHEILNALSYAGVINRSISTSRVYGMMNTHPVVLDRSARPNDPIVIAGIGWVSFRDSDNLEVDDWASDDMGTYWRVVSTMMPTIAPSLIVTIDITQENGRSRPWDHAYGDIDVRNK